MWPYWAYTYAPDPFQPALSQEQRDAGISVARCPGFDNDTAHYTCVPPPGDWANCWKCPPKARPWHLIRAAEHTAVHLGLH